MIRFAKLSDMEQIIKLWNKNSKNLNRYFKGDIIQGINENRWFVDCENEKVIGFCSYEIKKRLKRIAIKHLCIDSEYRKQHRATNILNFIYEQTKGIGLPYYVECLEGLENNGFYKKIGKYAFTREHETYNILVFTLFD